MRRWIAALIACAGCDKLFGIDSFPRGDAGATLDPDAKPSSYRRTITIHNSGPELAGYAVSIVTANDAPLIAHARPDGGDLVFRNAGGELATEIVYYAPGLLEAWVRIPTIAAFGTTTLTLSYGDSHVRTVPAEATWRSPYAAVWHLGDGQGADSTNTHPLIAGTATQGTWTDPAHVPALVGGGRRFDGTAQLLCASDPNHLLDFGLLSMSWSEWVHVDAMASGGVTLFKGGTSSGYPGFDLEVSATTGTAYVADGTIGTGVGVNQPTDLHWTQVAGVVDRSRMRLSVAVDGNTNHTNIDTIGSLSDANQPVCLTNNQGQPSFAYHGEIDELRIYDQAMPAEWFAFEYLNLTAREQIVTFGPEEPVY